MMVKIIGQWYALLMPPLGFLLNLLLIWLVLKRTPKVMRVHSRILLQTSLYDIFYLATMTIGVPFVLLADVDVLIYFGYFASLFHQLFGPFFLYYHSFVVFFFYYFDLYSVCIQFLYRYLALNRNIKVSMFQYLLMLSVAIAADLLIMAQYFFITPTSFKIPSENNANSTAADYAFLSDWSPLVFIINYDGKPSELFTPTLMASYVISYSIILFCGWKMVRFVNAHTGFNANLKAINKQMSLNLIILALIPLLSSFVDLATIGTLSFASNSLSGHQVLEFQFYNYLPAFWMPVMNPIVSILTNKPYRVAVLSLCKKKPALSIVTVKVSPVMAPAHSVSRRVHPTPTRTCVSNF